MSIHFESVLMSPEQRRPAVGLLVLEADEALEGDFRQRFDAQSVDIHVSRVRNPVDINLETLGAMAEQLAPAASLLPAARHFDIVAYGCTSGSAVIGSERVHAAIRSSCDTAACTDPLHALLQQCRLHSVRSLALVSPYVEAVSGRMRERLIEAGITVPCFGSFNIGDDAQVARIDVRSICNATRRIVEQARSDGTDVDAVFLSCTNLQAMSQLEGLRQELGLPVWSSNQVMADEVERVLQRRCQTRM